MTLFFKRLWVQPSSLLRLMGARTEVWGRFMSKLLPTPFFLGPVVVVRRGGHGVRQAEWHGTVNVMGLAGFDSIQPLFGFAKGLGPHPQVSQTHFLFQEKPPDIRPLRRSKYVWDLSFCELLPSLKLYAPQPCSMETGGPYSGQKDHSHFFYLAMWSITLVRIWEDAFISRGGNDGITSDLLWTWSNIMSSVTVGLSD